MAAFDCVAETSAPEVETALANVYGSDNFEPNRSVVHLMGRVRAEVLAAIDREIAQDDYLHALGVTATQFLVLMHLAGGSARKSASELCQEMTYDAGGMTRMVDRLESKGLVRRTRCAEDRRVVYLEVTKEGLEAYPRIRELSMVVQSRCLRGFSRAEVRKLECFLSRMFRNMV
jgi:DNA-binding MarR family transcriptional regulator